MKAAILALTLTLTPAVAGAVDLNAPLDMHPTLQTEMHRGFLAADQCKITLAPLDLDLCIDHIAELEQAKISNADPFELGLFLAAWLELDLKMGSDEGLPDNFIAQAQLPEDKRGAAANFTVVRGLQKKLGLTDAQVRAASGARQDIFVGRWKYWTSQDLAKP